MRAGRQCVVSAETERGKWKRRKRDAEEQAITLSELASESRDQSEPAGVPDRASAFMQTHDLSEAERELVQSLAISPSTQPSTSTQAVAGVPSPHISSRDLIREDLQNPADALDILCSVTGHTSAAPSRMPSPPSTAVHEVYDSSWPQSRTSYLDMFLDRQQPIPRLREACYLIRDGILSEDRLRQLVNTFIESYHPYYPLVATRRLAPALLARFSAEDPILLTAICVIASRSGMSNQLHLKLLGIVKDMLSGAMWGGCATVGAIEALLLLSEWVAPQLQIHSGEKVKETSMIWMIVGTVSPKTPAHYAVELTIPTEAVRLGYLQGLDKTSFVENGSDGTLQAGSRQRRTLAWASCYWSDRS